LSFCLTHFANQENPPGATLQARRGDAGPDTPVPAAAGTPAAPPRGLPRTLTSSNRDRRAPLTQTAAFQGCFSLRPFPCLSPLSHGASGCVPAAFAGLRRGVCWAPRPCGCLAAAPCYSEPHLAFPEPGRALINPAGWNKTLLIHWAGRCRIRTVSRNHLNCGRFFFSRPSSAVGLDSSPLLRR